MVQLNPAIRIIPPSAVSGSRWMVENVLDRRCYKLSKDAVALLILSCRPQDPHDLAKRMAKIAGNGERLDEYWVHLTDSLCARELIIDGSRIDSDPSLSWLVRLRKSWSRYGWHEAADYHSLTFDYPCLNYSEASVVIADQARMRSYQAVEPDTDRYKLNYRQLPETGLPQPSVDTPTATARAVWREVLPPCLFDAEKLSTVISLSFGATGSIVPRTQAAPLLRRSSPSGGGRHPTEGYVIVRDMPGIEPGLHHVTMQPFGLRRIGECPTDEDVLRRAFPETIERFPFPIRVLVVLTSVFERNMYRYREPRTFRTVHMDAGHIAATIRMTARSLGLAAGIYYCDAASQIEDLLDVDVMAEGYMLTVALADGVSDGK